MAGIVITVGVGDAHDRAIERVVGLNNLSRREAQVALCCAQGMTNAEIAQRLVVSVRTVDHHVTAVLAKLGVASRREVVRRAAELDLM